MVEQRKTQRFELRLPLKVVRQGPNPVKAVGVTKNLSSRGVLFAADAEVDLGESIEYVISMDPRSGEDQVELRCIGKVLRATSATEDPTAEMPYSVAATLERYEFSRPDSEDPIE